MMSHSAILKQPIPTVTQLERQVADTDANYEFYNGAIIEKEPMKQNEMFIYYCLLHFFMKTQAFKENGLLYPELDAPIDDTRKRIPDISYYKFEQTMLAKSGEKVTPSFAIEILSENEKMEDIEQKIQDYFDAGVQTVWYIHPKTKKIHVYTSPNDIKIYHDDMVINAQPALPDFEFPVNQLFEIESSVS